MVEPWRPRYLLDIEPRLSVFKNHHGSWSYVAAATTASGIHVTMKSRERLKREANEAGAVALARLKATCWQLEREAYARSHNPGCVVLLDWSNLNALCSCGADSDRPHPGRKRYDE
jgi:hypothetical protein